MTSKRFLIDSNVVVYSVVEVSPLYQTARIKLQDLSATGCTLCISPQVIREVLVTLTKPGLLTQPLSPEQACQDLKRLESSFEVLDDLPGQRQRLYELVSLFKVAGKRIHDANLIATMLGHGCGNLLTNNLEDFKRYSPIVGVEPL